MAEIARILCLGVRTLNFSAPQSLHDLHLYCDHLPRLANV
jgi:hypothetical protein